MDESIASESGEAAGEVAGDDDTSDVHDLSVGIGSAKCDALLTTLPFPEGSASPDALTGYWGLSYDDAYFLGIELLADGGYRDVVLDGSSGDVIDASDAADGRWRLKSGLWIGSRADSDPEYGTTVDKDIQSVSTNKSQLFGALCGSETWVRIEGRGRESLDGTWVSVVGRSRHVTLNDELISNFHRLARFELVIDGDLVDYTTRSCSGRYDPEQGQIESELSKSEERGLVRQETNLITIEVATPEGGMRKIVEGQLIGVDTFVNEHEYSCARPKIPTSG